MRSFGGRRFRNGKVKGKLPDWRSANSHLSFVGGWEVATKKEHLAILARSPQLEDGSGKETRPS